MKIKYAYDFPCCFVLEGRASKYYILKAQPIARVYRLLPDSKSLIVKSLLVLSPMKNQQRSVRIVANLFAGHVAMVSEYPSVKSSKTLVYYTMPPRHLGRCLRVANRFEMPN